MGTTSQQASISLHLPHQQELIVSCIAALRWELGTLRRLPTKDYTGAGITSTLPPAIFRLGSPQMIIAEAGHAVCRPPCARPVASCCCARHRSSSQLIDVHYFILFVVAGSVVCHCFVPPCDSALLHSLCRHTTLGHSALISPCKRPAPVCRLRSPHDGVQASDHPQNRPGKGRGRSSGTSA